MFETELRHLLLEKGANLVGFSSLGELAPPEFSELKYAVTIVRRLSDTIVKTIEGRPSMMYFHHYRTTNTKLDLLALDAVDFIEEQGYRALPVAASQSTPTDKEAYRGIFPHKTAAVLSGLGFIGKNALFITPEYGSRIRLCTVLTDMPLVAEGPVMQPQCGDCTICKNACPAGAITGALYEYGAPRASILDAKKCSEHMKTYKDIGRGAVCGLCMRACPHNAKPYK
ncbi:MAG: epoxyqueuosine reductase [Clostridia bacterium]|nr:epoxyqueuosine reductase [Clostridia bacterium]